MRLDAIPFRPRVTLEGAARTLTRQAADKVDLSHEIPDTVADRVVGDPGQLRQVLSERMPPREHQLPHCRPSQLRSRAKNVHRDTSPSRNS